jgi:3-hydroxyisobutyrate dehydrogenase-like beta-hydroxyacid dehydrogenase
MATVGVLGLGRMGAPIARRLDAAGFDVISFDPRVGGPGVAAVAGASDVLLTVLPGAAEVEEAVPAVFSAARPGTLWIDLTSNDPRVAEGVEREATERGIDFVGAPMGGGPREAASGTLRFFVGGVAIERVRPVLGTLGTIDYLGAAVGAGYSAKLIVNLLWFGQVAAVTEALLLGQSLGLSPSMLRTLLPTTAAGSAFIDGYLDNLLRGDYLETFGIDRCVAELDILAGLAHENCVPFELSGTVTRLHREALERFGAVDGEMLVAKLLELKAGAQLRETGLPEG